MIKNILCIHENEYFVKALSNILLRHDLFVSGFDTMEEAGSFIKEYRESLDLVIIGGPLKDGTDTTEIARFLRRDLHVRAPIMGLAPSISRDLLKKARESGINIFLPEKIKESDLMKHIKVFDLLWSEPKPASILLIDENPLRRERHLFELRGGNFTAWETSEGLKGVMLAEENNPDYIVLSDSLTDKDCFEVSRALKSNRPTSHIPIILLTKALSAELKRKSLMAGIVDFYVEDEKSSAFLWFITEIVTKISEKKYKSALHFSNFPIMIHTVNYILQKEGYNVLNTSQCTEAENIINEGNIDVILCDIGTSTHSFPMLQRYALSREKGQWIPIVLIAGPGDMEELLYGLQEFADDFIKTPFFPEELIKRINNQVKMKETGEYIFNQSQNLKMLSITDFLTGAYNRNYLNDTLDSFISRYKRKKRMFSALMIQVEDFSKIVSLFGNLTGDEILRKVTAILEQTLRPTDMIFRFGEDDFIVLLEDTPEENLRIVAERILEKFENTMLSEESGNYHRVNLLVGALAYSGESREDVLSKLDKEIEKMKKAYE
ncbi:MAG TPA: diguanylate cyclase [Candidatus Mcinerneyibacteriales bacterium]|nr:diguanylate cyclase [Candidatus Mcinerneyibacteriales bacterium]HPJ70728.1 diguanylate cyclase [Candidatus Mcinerneyibacteriales bacterium]